MYFIATRNTETATHRPTIQDILYQFIMRHIIISPVPT